MFLKNVPDPPISSAAAKNLRGSAGPQRLFVCFVFGGAGLFAENKRRQSLMGTAICVM